MTASTDGLNAIHALKHMMYALFKKFIADDKLKQKCSYETQL